MIVARTTFTTQDVGHYAQASKSIAGCLRGGIDLFLSWAFGDMNAWLLLRVLGFILARGRVGDELLLDLIWVEDTSSFLIRFIDFLLVASRLTA